MKVRIIDTKSNKYIGAEIKDGTGFNLPTPSEGWKFDFSTFSKRPGSKVFVLVTDDNPNKIEGCLIFKLINNVEPNMAYVEVGPYNGKVKKNHELIGECLIAFACKLSFQFGKHNYKGWLSFTVQEEKPTDQKKLMDLYKNKYFAKKLTNTAMIIEPVRGEFLIEKYLEIE